jgi:hypothetical protein
LLYLPKEQKVRQKFNGSATPSTAYVVNTTMGIGGTTTRSQLSSPRTDRIVNTAGCDEGTRILCRKFYLMRSGLKDGLFNADFGEKPLRVRILIKITTKS